MTEVIEAETIEGLLLTLTQEDSTCTFLVLLTRSPEMISESTLAVLVRSTRPPSCTILTPRTLVDSDLL